jgi:hypothetical protein
MHMKYLMYNELLYNINKKHYKCLWYFVDYVVLLIIIKLINWLVLFKDVN